MLRPWVVCRLVRSAFTPRSSVTSRHQRLFIESWSISARYCTTAAQKPPLAVITGGTRGIGRAIAQYLYNTGNYHIVILGRSAETATRVAEEIHAASRWTDRKCSTPPDVTIQGHACDVRQFDAVQRVLETVHADTPPALLINAAGIIADTLLVRSSEQNMNDIIDTNLKGALFASRAFLNRFLRYRRAHVANTTPTTSKCHIITIGSVVGTRIAGNPGQVVYAASKAALVGMTRSLAAEMASRDVCVNLIAPGFIDTDMTAPLMASRGSDWIHKTIPLRRLGSPEDVVQAVRYLIESTYVTGQTIVVDGGLSLMS